MERRFFARGARKETVPKPQAAALRASMRAPKAPPATATAAAPPSAGSWRTAPTRRVPTARAAMPSSSSSSARQLPSMSIARSSAGSHSSARSRRKPGHDGTSSAWHKASRPWSRRRPSAQQPRHQPDARARADGDPCRPLAAHVERPPPGRLRPSAAARRCLTEKAWNTAVLREPPASRQIAEPVSSPRCPHPAPPRSSARAGPARRNRPPVYTS